MSEFDTIIAAAKKKGIPTAVPVRLKAINDTEFEKGKSAYYRDIVNNIVLPKDVYDRLTKTKKLTDSDLATLYNEMEHAFYDQELEENTVCEWLYAIVKDEAKKRYGDNMCMVDEAMSETFDALVNEFTRFIVYKDKLNLSYKRNAQEPGHTDKDEKWHGNALAKKTMSKVMYFTTLYIFYNGCTPPKTYSPTGKTLAQHKAGVTKWAKDKHGLE